MSEFKRLMRETMWGPTVLSVFLTVLLAIGVNVAPIATIYSVLFVAVVALVFCLVKMVSYL